MGSAMLIKVGRVGGLLGAHPHGLGGSRVGGNKSSLGSFVAQVDRGAAAANVDQFVSVWLRMLTMAQGPQEYEEVAWYAAINALSCPGGLIGLNRELAAHGMRQPLPNLLLPGLYSPVPGAKWRYYWGGGLLSNLPDLPGRR
jgi:hypothetical protein